MDKTEPSITHPTKINDRPGWEFILPSLVLVGLIGLPILALIWRSINSEIISSSIFRKCNQCIETEPNHQHN